MSDKRISTEAWKNGKGILELHTHDGNRLDIPDVLESMASAWGLQPPRPAPKQPPVHLRAWLIDQQVMARVYKCEWENGVIVRVYTYKQWYKVPEAAYVMLGSGLFDKHCTEIFVDDVISSDRLLDIVQYFRVTHKEGRFWATDGLLWSIYGGCEIVGNIHANSELEADE